jgi:ADP-ribose pyrophosphatase YjhB (NUDIX family)
VSPGVTVAALEREPRVAETPPPSLSPASATAAVDAGAWIAGHAHLIDGPVLMTAAAAPGDITVFAATYAWHVASRAGGVPEAGLGGLGVQIAVADRGRGLLWQRRSDEVDHPGAWSISAAGVAVPGRGLREQALDELREELGLGPAEIEGPEPMALVVSAPSRTVQVVYRARLRPGAEPRPDRREVAELAWAEDPCVLDGPLDALTGSWCEVLVALARVH